MDLAQTRPRFRTDLVAQPIEEGGQRFVDVTDPDSGKTFRFYEIEYSIACAMDGERDLDGLVDWAHAELGLEPSSDELATVVTTLAELGYLEDVPPSGLDLDLGHAGMSEVAASDDVPAAPDIELGVAGVLTAAEDERSFDAADVPLGVAGNEGLTMEPAPSYEEEEEISMVADDDEGAGGTEQSFAGLMDEEPTKIKPGRDAAAAREAMEAASAPAAPPMVPVALDDSAAEPQPTLRPVGGSDADEDGPTNLPPPASDFDDEVSVDLTDHLHLGPDAVKEAVRQSKLMPVVDVPMMAQDASSAATADAPPVELPEKPVSVSRPPVQEEEEPLHPPPPKPQSSGMGLIIGLALAVLLLVAVVVAALDIGGIRTKLLGGGEPTETVVQPPPQTTQTNTAQQEQPAAKVELPTATLEQAEGAPAEVKAAQAGVLQSILASGTEVQADDVVAKLDGYQKLETVIAAARNDKVRYEKRIAKFTEKKEAAEAAGNEAEAAKQQKGIDEQLAKIAGKDKEIEEAEAAMEAFMLKAPAAGVIETSLAAKAKVEADQLVFVMKGSPVLRATFTVPEQKELSAGTEVQLASKADDDKTLECMVTKVDGQQVLVECPADGGLEAGAEVVLRP